MVSGKKVALWGCLGCGGFVLAIVLLSAGGIGFFAYEMYRFGKGIQETYTQVAEEYKALDEEYPFACPEDGILSEERLDTFLQIRQKVAAHAREQYKRIEQTSEKIKKEFDHPGVIAKIEGAKTIKALIRIGANMASEIGQEHIRLLDGEDMSVKEYQWLTLTYLGTLAKAEDYHAEDLADHWKRYLEAFQSARRKVKDIHMQFGAKSVRGGDMNPDKLVEALKSVEYIPKNAECIARTMDCLLPDKTWE